MARVILKQVPSSMPPLLLFDDGRSQMGPLTDLRPTWDLRTGILTNKERIEQTLGPVSGLIVGEHLAELVRESSAVGVNDDAEFSGDVMLVNGSFSAAAALPEISPGTILYDVTGRVVAARVDGSESAAVMASSEVESDPDRPRLLSTTPWDLLDDLEATLVSDAASSGQEWSPSAGVEIIGDGGVLAHEGVRVDPGAVLDTRSGPIVLGRNASIATGAVVVGPCAIGDDSSVLVHGQIKAKTVIGPSCKVAGEIGGTIMQGYANKSHAGHLGDSIIGEWVNLGAGTTNSNLLNTYGDIVMQLEPRGKRRRTRRQFMGAVIGDHVKFAIGSRIMTGTCVGTGAMFAASTLCRGVVDRFAWLTDSAPRVFRLDKFLEVASVVMERRGRSLTSAMVARLTALHEQTTGQD